MPLNPHYSKGVITLDSHSSITFIVLNQDYLVIAKYILVQNSDESFDFLRLSEEETLSLDMHSAISQTVLNFLNEEFEVECLRSHYEKIKFLNLDSINQGTELLTHLANRRDKSIEITLNPKPASEIILTAGPSISILEQAYVYDATKNGWNSDSSNYLGRFESVFAEYVGVKHAMATSSCTGALHLSLLALGIGHGDEVLVPDITWVATASAVRYVGAKPIFVDVDKSNWVIDVKAASKLISPRTKAIIPVHLYGFGAPMPEIMNLAEKHSLYVVEDAAPAIGTKIADQFAGTFGDFGCYSFQGAKLLVTGEGGMLVTNNSEFFAKARKIQDHGRRPGTFWIEELGHKYKMNNITAALGLGQIQRAENQIFRKRRIYEWYRELLADVPGISFQNEAISTRSICWMTSFTLDSSSKIKRDELISELKNRGIDTRPVFPSISQYKIWGYDAQIPQNSKYLGDHGINLPSGVLLSRKSIEKVARAIKEVLH